jgi:lipopolysaccharide export system protein LptC
MSWRLWLGLALAAVAAFVGLSLLRQGPGAVAPQPGGRADYLLVDFQLVALDEQGRESFTLRAPRLARDPAVRTLDIATPLFVIPPRAGAAGTPWEVRSKTAWVSEGGDEIRLRGDVLATSTDGSGRPVRLETQRLNVFPETRRATSDVEVSLRQPGFILNGQSLEAFLDTKRVFLKDIKARYE